MKFTSFEIVNYRGISEPLKIDLKKDSLIPLIGINECGKTTILQAIFCFDLINDGDYNKKHITNTLNLYKPTNKEPPVITAGIEMSYIEFENRIKVYNSNEVGKQVEKHREGFIYKAKKINDLPPKELFKSDIKICRNLETKKYFFLDSELKLFNPIAKELIYNLPYILYNDDFMERPPNEIEIPKKEGSLTGWNAIFNRLFEATNNDYSLFEISKVDDERIRESILSDVEVKLNERLSKAWKTFLLSKNDELQVKLRMVDNKDDNSQKIVIKIVEKIRRKDRYFDVADRSKGFLWFFNFVMKLEFNPKSVGKRENTIFLLDEPGSYLHSSAQEKLCIRIKEISEKMGKVIYCTHSHNLLKPDVIPFNKIYIVEKQKNKNIKASLITSHKPKGQNLSAYQPIFDALQIPVYDIFEQNKPIIAVEGIYDKYVITLFCNSKEEFNILPGTSANSIVKNIQFLNGFSRKYIAIWDNDEEGRKEYKNACKIYGEYEKHKFDKLPLLDRENRIMERMFENDDLKKLKNLLLIEKDTSYEKIMAILFHSKKSIKEKARNIISEKTKNNFKILSEIIEKRIKKSLEIDESSDKIINY